MCSTRRPITYPVRNAILRQFSFWRRTQLARQIPTLRRENDRIGFNFHKVNLLKISPDNLYYIFIDEIRIALEMESGEVKLTYSRFDNDDLQPFAIKWEKLASINAIFDSLIVFYLDRPATFIRNELLSFRWDQLKNFKNCVIARCVTVHSDVNIDRFFLMMKPKKLCNFAIKFTSDNISALIQNLLKLDHSVGFRFLIRCELDKHQNVLISISKQLPDEAVKNNVLCCETPEMGGVRIGCIRWQISNADVIIFEKYQSSVCTLVEFQIVEKGSMIIK